MATNPTDASSVLVQPDRRARRRRETIEEALDHAEQIMTEQGVGGLTVTEVARRMGVRSPSLYKYFSSLHAVYDALFARGVERLDESLESALSTVPPSPERFRVGVKAVVGWCVEHPGLAQLMFWRPVPGFEPSPETFEASVAQMRDVRGDLAEAVRAGQLHPSADSDEAARILTVLISGLITQQMANQPGVDVETGLFTSLTDEVFDMFLAHYDPDGGS
jgi:AcrR family transcriptional regulator